MNNENNCVGCKFEKKPSSLPCASCTRKKLELYDHYEARNEEGMDYSLMAKRKDGIETYKSGDSILVRKEDWGVWIDDWEKCKIIEIKNRIIYVDKSLLYYKGIDFDFYSAHDAIVKEGFEI